MQRLPFCLTFMLALTWLAGAADYKLKDGTTLSGEPVMPATDKGVVIRTSDNKFLPRAGWTNFSQEALKELAKNPKIRPFVETLIDEPAPGAGGGAEVIVPEVPVTKRPPAKWAEVWSKPELPESPGMIGGIFGTGVGWLSLVLCYAATIYAGYEVSIYRRRPRNLVMGLAAIPLVGIFSPITFLIMPPIQTEEERKPNAVEQAALQAAEGHKPEEKKGFVLGKAEPKAAAASGAKPVSTAKPGAPVAVAAPSPVNAPAAPGAPAAAASLEPVVYRRGETNINKRFIETKFAGFFKAVPGPAEKDMWVVWVTATGGEHWSKRIVSISQTELVVNCPQEGGGSLDETMQLVEIQEIHLRPQEG
ncbi:MAG: hypothetical protein ACKODH_02175 [Limisphaerales bacterium]